MRTNVKTSFLNPGSTFHSGVPTLSEGTSRAVRYWARPKRTARTRTASTAANTTPFLTAVCCQGICLAPLSPWARLGSSSPAAGGGPRGNGAPPPAPGASAAWHQARRPGAAAAPVGNALPPDREDPATAEFCRLEWPRPDCPATRWLGPGSDKAGPPAG